MVSPLAEHPSDYPALLSTVDVMRQMYLFDEALSQLERLEHPRTASLRVRILLRAGRENDAMRLMESSGELADDVEMRANRVAVLDRLHRFTDLAALLRRETHRELLNSGDPLVYRVRLAEARALASQGRLVDGMAEFEAIARTKDTATVNGWWINSLMRAGRLEAATGLAVRLARGGGNDGWRRKGTAGRVLSRLGQSDLAIEALEQAISEQPSYTNGWRWLSTTLRSIGDFTKADQVLCRANEVLVSLSGIDGEQGRHLARMADHPLLLVERASWHLAQYDGVARDHLVEAMTHTDRALDLCPDCPEAVWAKARILRAMGGRDSINGLRRLAKQNRSSAVNARVELGHALGDAARWPDALAEYGNVLRESMHNRDALLGRLTIMANQVAPTGSVSRASDVPQASGLGPDAVALAECVKAISQRLPDDVVILSIAAERLAQGGHYDHASELFTQVLDGRANPAHDLSFAGAIRAWAWARDFPKADDVLRRAMSIAEESTPHCDLPLVVRLAKGMMLGDCGRFAEANEQLVALHTELAGQPPQQRSRDDFAAAALWASSSFRWLFEHEHAVEAVEAALESAPGQHELFTRAADLHDELGWTFLERHEWHRSAASFERALSIDPHHPAAIRGLVQVHRATGNTEAAERAARRGLNLHPRSANMLCEMAWLHGEAGKFLTAQRYLDAALARECANIHALEWKIVYLMREGKLEEAQRIAQKAVALRPEAPGIIEAACAVHLRRGDAHRTIELATAAWKAHPDDHVFAMIAAGLCEQADKTGDDWKKWVSRLSAFSSSPEAVRMSASLLRQHKELREALQVIDAHLPTRRWPGLIGEQAEVLIDQDQFEDALTLLRELYVQVPWAPSVARRIATVLATHNRLSEALDFTEEVIAQAEVFSSGADPVELLVLRGEILLCANRFEEAKAVARRAAQHPTRGVVEARVLEIDAVGATGDVDGALRLAQALRAQRPASRRTRLILARCLEEARRSREAADLLGNGDKSLPRHAPAVVMASWIRRGLHEWQMARKLVDDTLKLLPDDAVLLAERGRILLEQGNSHEARRIYEGLTHRLTGHERALGHTGLGWCALQEVPQDARLAAQSFLTATELDPQLPEASLGACVAHRLWANGEHDEEQRTQQLIESLTHAQRLVSLDLTASSHRTMGRAAYELRETATALHHLTQSVALHPYRGDRAGLGLLLLRQAAPDDAITLLLSGMAGGADDQDLLAALGAAYLDRDLRSGRKGPDTHLALHYLREAHALQPDHLFAAHNLATALVQVGDTKSAEEVLQTAINEVRRNKHNSTDIDDVPMLELRLAEILRQRTGAASREAKSRANDLLKSVRKNARERVKELARTHVLTRGEEPSNDIRPPGNLGRVMTAISVAGLICLWSIWLSGVGTKTEAMTIWFMLSITSVLLGSAFAGLLLPTLLKLRLGAVEINNFVTLSQIANRDLLELPEPVRPPTSLGRVDAIRTRWITLWSSDTRLPRLGPAVGPLINTHYAHRDAFIPWRRL